MLCQQQILLDGIMDCLYIKILNAEHAVIVGQGIVALNVARILIRSVD